MTRSRKISDHIALWMDQVETGEVAACHDMVLLVKMVRRSFQRDDVYTDEALLEQYLGLAKYFPFPQLFPWQEFVLGLHYCTFWRDGAPRWPKLLCMIARGAGKDGTIAMGGACMVSPYHPVRKYDVDICALNEEQAMRPNNDFWDVLQNPEQMKKLARFYEWNKVKIQGRKNGGTMRGRTNNPKGKDGMRSGEVIFNEIHQYQNYANFNVFITSLGKVSEPRQSFYTTNGNVRGGPLDDKLVTASAVLRGEEPDNGLLPFLCHLDDKEEVHDEKNWEKANPSLRYLPPLLSETRDEYRDWVKAPNQHPDFMAKRMNLPSNMSDVAITAWDNIAATADPVPELLGQSCTLGIDYAKTNDLVSANLHFRLGDRRYDLNHSWLCLQSADLDRIKAPWRDWADAGLLTPVDDVEIHPELLEAWIGDAMTRYNIVGAAIDNFRYTLMAGMLKRLGFDSKDKKNLALVRPSDMMRAMPLIDSCFNNHYFAWGEHPLLRWATNNTKLVAVGRQSGQDMGNFTYGKIEAKSRKTDPFMALAASMTIEDKLGDGTQSAYTDYGVITC